MDKWTQHTIELIVICLVLIGIAAFYNTYQASLVNHSEHGKHSASVSSSLVIHYVNNRSVPTLYFHGLQGSARSTNHLIAVGAKTDGRKVMDIDVTRRGQIRYHGNLNGRSDDNPLIQVNFLDNTASVNQQSIWIHKILQHLKTTYHCKNYNAVAHSAGAVAVLLATDRFGHNHNVAKLQKFVSIGGPYDGVIGMNDRPNANHVNVSGRPRIFRPANRWYPSYSQLVNNSHKFPKNVEVLNIYGNISPRVNDDQYVSTASARSLKYLLFHRVRDYQEIQIRGNYAQHSLLHQNSVVDRVVDRFIFNE